MLIQLSRTSGMGQASPARRPVTSEVQKSLSVQARSLNERSSSAPVVTLVGLEAEIKAATLLLDSYVPWTDSGWFGSYDSSQTVRANLQAALSNIRIRTGVKEGTILGQQKDVSVAAEFAKEAPVEVKKAVDNATNKATECVQNPIMCAWEKTTTQQKIAIGIGGAVVVGGAALYTLTVFGSAISAAGNVADKMSRNKRRR